MNSAIITKVSSAKSAEEMRAIIAKADGKIYAEKHAEGYEVRDLRKLADRLNTPISGRGVVRWFGYTHHVVTPTLLAKFDNVVFA